MKRFNKTKICLAVMLSFGATGHVLFGQTNTFPSSGNAGIGTTSPTNALEIYGNAKRILFRSQLPNHGGDPALSLAGTTWGFLPAMKTARSPIRPLLFIPNFPTTEPIMRRCEFTAK